MERAKTDFSSPFLTLEVEDHFYIFDGGNAVLSEVDKIVYDILSLSRLYDLYNEEDCADVVNILKKNYLPDEIEETIEILRNYNKQGFLAEKARIYDLLKEKDEKKLSINCLWLNIVHDCNLRCKYCFGNGGDYGHKRIMMTKEIAKKCIDYWYSHISTEQKFFEVAFFGGEPLMNKEVMFFTVEYINNLFKDTDVLIRYNLTTNGTILDDQFLRLFTSNNFKINISIDGLKKIQNRNRPYVSGRGSFDDVIKNIKTLTKHLKYVPSQITLTKKDIPFLRQSVENLWEQGVNLVYSNLVFNKAEIYEYEDYEEYHRQIKELSNITYQNIIEDKPFYYNSLTKFAEKIHQKKPSINCFFWNKGAFIFSPEGTAYKCHRFVENNKYGIGNIIDNPGLDLVQQRFTKERVEKCINCWAQFHCGDGCPYENEVYSENINVPAESWCVKTKIALKESLKLYARLVKNNPKKAKEFFNWR